MSMGPARVLAVVVSVASAAAAPFAAEPRATPEAKALRFLAREVPAWARENRCFSCHNNGDAARALYEAVRRGEAVPPDALAGTTDWLARPDGWDENGGDGPFSDKVLARVQFASALASAVDAGAVKGRDPLIRAADRVARDQAADGSWPIEGDPAALGSPAGYGRPLATLAARDLLRRADPERFRKPIERADRWLDARPLDGTLGASVALLALDGRAETGLDAGARGRRARALDRLRKGQGGDGGWGPYADTPFEPFDTALALIALSRLAPAPETRALIARGRDALAAAQQADGSWPETTRPRGARSYAQLVSTAGWAALALLATRGRY